MDDHPYSLPLCGSPWGYILKVGSILRWQGATAKLLQSCPTLSDPIDSSPPGSPVPGILQARTLEWVAISFSSAWKWKVKVKSLSRVQLLATPWTAPTRLLHPWDFPGKSTVPKFCISWWYEWEIGLIIKPMELWGCLLLHHSLACPDFILTAAVAMKHWCILMMISNRWWSLAKFVVSGSKWNSSQSP